MFEFGTFEITYLQWGLLAFCAFLVGASKTGIPGVSIVVVPMVATIVDPKASVGLLLPMLIFADIFAAGYYRRKAQWFHIVRLFPWTLCGIVAGYFAMGYVSSSQLKPIIGGIVLVMIGLKYWLGKTNEASRDFDFSDHWVFAAVVGFFIGLTTMMANAAGPVMMIYLLSTNLKKFEFVGTTAWFFFIINWVKVPFNAKLDLITAESLKLDATLFPMIAVGAIAGIYALKYIPQKKFNTVVLLLAVAGGVKLLFW